MKLALSSLMDKWLNEVSLAKINKYLVTESWLNWITREKQVVHSGYKVRQINGDLNWSNSCVGTL